MKQMGLLVMAYGTPYSEDDLLPYYTHIRHGKTPSPELVEDLRKRYEAIGGISPLAAITQKQAEAIEKAINTAQHEITFKMYLGLKHIDPFIEDAVQQMKKDGIREAVSIVLAPHYSTYSAEIYNRRAINESRRIGGPIIYTIDSWYDEPLFIQYWAKHIQDILKEMTESEKKQTTIIFSAHSLPEKIKQLNDPYPVQLEETARLIAENIDPVPYHIGWQSEGNTPEPWLRPDVQDLTRDLFGKGYRSFIYAPVGFVADHLEVLYDNDIECKAVTDELNARYDRPPMPNTDPQFIKALANAVFRRAGQSKTSKVSG